MDDSIQQFVEESGAVKEENKQIMKELSKVLAENSQEQTKVLTENLQKQSKVLIEKAQDQTKVLVENDKALREALNDFSQEQI